MDEYEKRFRRLEAERRIEIAREAVADADPALALEAARDAVIEALDGEAGELAARAFMLGSQALAMQDRLNSARSWAFWATELLASSHQSGSEQHIWAICQVFETCELLGQFEAAAGGFLLLSRDVELKRGWRADVHQQIANHLISIGLKTQDVALALRGVVDGQRAQDLGEENDERAALEQWRAIFELRRGEPELAGPRLLKSFAYRSKSRKREITKLFPLAHLACAEGDLATCFTLLDDGIVQAFRQGMWRYASAGMRLRECLAREY